MKKALFVFCFTFFIFAAFAAPVDLETAKVAAQAWAARGGTLGARMGTMVEGGATHVTDEGAKFYAVKTTNGGTIFLSADDTLNPILGFTGSTDDFSEIDRESPLWAMLSQAVNKGLGGSGGLKLTTSSVGGTSQTSGTGRTERWTRLLAEGAAASGKLKLTTSSTRAEIGDVRVPVLVESHWSQMENAYNYYTPNKYYCGCVATALAQVMRYWCWPTNSVTAATKSCKVDGAAQNLTMKGGVYDWANMPLKYAGTYGGNYTATEKEAVGKLCYDAGVAVHTSYGSSGSSAPPSCAIDAFMNNFHYANAVYTGGGEKVSQERLFEVLRVAVYPSLDAGLPVMTEIPGHEIVADGYGYNDGLEYIHFNYGWGGSNDAWFSAEDLSVNTFVYNVMPENRSGAENPLNQAIISGRVTDRKGAPLEGVQVEVIGNKEQGIGVVVTNVLTSAYGVWAAIVSTEGTATYDAVFAKDGYQAAQITDITALKPSGNFPTVAGNSWGNDAVLDEMNPASITSRCMWAEGQGRPISSIGRSPSRTSAT